MPYHQFDFNIEICQLNVFLKCIKIIRTRNTERVHYSFDIDGSTIA